MKKALLLMAVFACLGCASEARAGVSIHVNISTAGRVYHGHGYGYFYSPGYFYPGVYYPDYEPFVPYTPPQTAAPESTPPAPPPPAPAAQTTQPKVPNPVPFGFNLGTGLVQSPWSGFVINGANKSANQVVYDANTGQAFRIPAR